MRRFYFDRQTDVSGTSGTGAVVEGVQFSDGSVYLRWMTSLTSWAHYRDIEECVKIHGHDGMTNLVWVDDEPSVPQPEVELPIIAFSGSRGFADDAIVERVMRGLVKKHGPRMRVRVGDAKRGLDVLAGKNATRWGIWPWVEVCYWPEGEGATKYLRWLAAHERNERVVIGSPTYPGIAMELWAFFAPGPRSPGTSDAIRIALAEGVPVKVYHSGQWTDR